MQQHKFWVGQAVGYFPTRNLYAARGAYQVTAELPFQAGEFQYRVKHPLE